MTIGNKFRDHGRRGRGFTSSLGRWRVVARENCQLTLDSLIALTFYAVVLVSLLSYYLLIEVPIIMLWSGERLYHNICSRTQRIFQS